MPKYRIHSGSVFLDTDRCYGKCGAGCKPIWKLL